METSLELFSQFKTCARFKDVATGIENVNKSIRSCVQLKPAT